MTTQNTRKHHFTEKCGHHNSRGWRFSKIEVTAQNTARWKQMTHPKP